MLVFAAELLVLHGQVQKGSASSNQRPLIRHQVFFSKLFGRISWRIGLWATFPPLNSQKRLFEASKGILVDFKGFCLIAILGAQSSFTSPGLFSFTTAMENDTFSACTFNSPSVSVFVLM